MEPEKRESMLRRLEAFLAPGKACNAELAYLLAEGYTNVGNAKKAKALLKKTEPLLKKGDMSIAVADDIMEYREETGTGWNPFEANVADYGQFGDRNADWNMFGDIPVQAPYKREPPK